MLPLDEMLLKAQNGAAVDMVSRQFDLSRDQTVAAMEALLPAFSQGLKRTAATPQGIEPFLQALAGGNHSKYMQDMASAFSPGGVADGNGILGHLFGSKDVSRAVADHAARATGIGQDILQQMLPTLASMVMGGLFDQSTGRMNAASGGAFGASGNIIGEVIEQMMRQGQGSSRRQSETGRYQRDTARDEEPPSQTPNPFENPFGKILQDMFGGAVAGGQHGQRQSGRGGRQMSGGDNPLGRIFEDMLSGGMVPGSPNTGQTRRTERQREPERQTSRRQEKNPYEDLFGQMFETGRKAQDDYQRGVESIFDQFLSGMDKRR